MDTRRSSRLRISLLLLLCGLTFAGCPPPGRADEVTDWNVLAIDVLALAGHNNIVMTRGLAMAHLATHDALNAIDRRYEPFAIRVHAPRGASQDAAAAAAAHDVLVHYFPANTAALDADLANSLAAIPDGQSRTDGVGVGHAVATQWLALRTGDGLEAPLTYT